MDIPAWLNRETVQLVLMVAVTLGVHYYFISSRLANYKPEAEENNADNGGIIIENTNQA